MTTDKSFKFTIPTKILRTMNREQYYKAMSWLRECERVVQQEIEIFEKKAAGCMYSLRGFE